MSRERNTALAAELGLAATVMLKFPRYFAYPLACLEQWTRPAVLLDQLRVFWSAGGEPIGYVTWAWLAPDVERRLCEDPRCQLDLSEWNEGEHLWFLDLAAAPGQLAGIVAALAQQFGDCDEARFLRRDERGRVRKRSLWRRDAQGRPRARRRDAERRPC